MSGHWHFLLYSLLQSKKKIKWRERKYNQNWCIEDTDSEPEGRKTASTTNG